MIVTAAQILADVEQRSEPKHGTLNAYSRGRCRCQECRDAHAEYARKLRARHRAKGLPATVKHGTLNAYNNLGCNCQECRACGTASNRAYRARRAAS